jgi:3-hydroxyisobutyrate dehydrogenase
MAARLLAAGHLTAVWNRSAMRTRALEAAGAVVAGSPAETVDGADIVCLCLTDDAAVREVSFGERGIIEGCARHKSQPLVIDFSTSSPAATKSLARDYQIATGGSWVDAPVSGGVQRAQDGSLIAYCGGDARDFARAQPILTALTSRSTLLGPIGSGQATKLIAQLIAAPMLVAIAEALATAEAMGLASRELIDVFSGSLVDSPLLQIFGRRMATGQREPKIGAIATMLKDIDNAVAMAGSSGALVPFGSAAAEIFRSIQGAGASSEEITALMEHYRRRSGHVK